MFHQQHSSALHIKPRKRNRKTPKQHTQNVVLIRISHCFPFSLLSFPPQTLSVQGFFGCLAVLKSTNKWKKHLPRLPSSFGEGTLTTEPFIKPPTPAPSQLAQVWYKRGPGKPRCRDFHCRWIPWLPNCADSIQVRRSPENNLCLTGGRKQKILTGQSCFSSEQKLRLKSTSMWYHKIHSPAKVFFPVESLTSDRDVTLNISWGWGVCLAEWRFSNVQRKEAHFEALSWHEILINHN